MLGVAGMGVAGMGGGRQGEIAGLPKLEELFEATENARENGRDQGIQQSDTRLPHLRGAAQAGDLVAEGGCMCFHATDNN